MLAMTTSDFPLPTLGPRLQGLAKILDQGRGFRLLRGLPIQDLTERQAASIYWGMGLHMGTPVSQNARGHLLGHVIGEGVDYKSNSGARGYQTRLRLPGNYSTFHSRTQYGDFDDPAERRHLLRLWLALREARPIPDDFGRGANNGSGGRDFTAAMSNLKWVADVTEFKCVDGKLYLAGILDLHDRGLAGWSMSERNNTDLVVNALHPRLDIE